MGGGDHSPSETLRAGRAQRRIGPLLEHTEELHLHAGADLPDLVQEDHPLRRAAGEGALRSADGAGEGPLLVPEEGALQQGAGDFGEVQGDEGPLVALGERARLGIPGDEAGPAEGRRGDALSSPGLAEQDQREVLHAVPEVLLVAAHVLGEELVPERFPEGAHGGARADERVADEEEGAPQLIEELEDPTGPGAGPPGGGQEASDGAMLGKGDRVGDPTLALDQRVEVVREAMEGVEEQSVLHQLRVLATVLVHRTEGLAELGHPSDRPVDHVVGVGVRPRQLGVQGPAQRAEGVGEGRLAGAPKEIPIRVFHVHGRYIA